MPDFTSLISCESLRPHLEDDRWRVVDCRFQLTDPERGLAEYREAHIPGAVYAHLEEDLSGPHLPGRTGRHPLPEPAAFAEVLSRWGIRAGTQVVAYDSSGGAIAARLWWMLRWMRHPGVAVLDGGWKAWLEAGYSISSGAESVERSRFDATPDPTVLVEASEVERISRSRDWRLIDARAQERFCGEAEPIDPVAGHIPGALSAPFGENLDRAGRMLEPEHLRERYASLLGEVDPSRAVVYCGSGVTAAHDILAMEHAGLSGARLYPGSWSEWITDPSRPVAT